MDLDLRLVRYFVAVGEELHFGRAAARLFISQPALSKQIRKLEAEVGGPLLVRDSRNVMLTERGARFFADARQLLAVADRMRHDADVGTVRIAHVFELATSRLVADAFARAHPGVTLVERQQDSYRQLRSLLARQLDVAIVRVTPRMLQEYPVGWRHRPLRREPLLLVGRPGEPVRATASLHERPLEVFADPPGSGLYNAHGEFLTALEHDNGVALRWLGNPGMFLHCFAVVRRAAAPGFVLEFESYAERYADAGCPVHRPEEQTPAYPWAIAWRDEPPTEAVEAFLDVAAELARARGWSSVPDADPAATQHGSAVV
ncbi:MAG: LysR family transcriptional regulator [Jatrophihabitans sp.]|uniref:LysR family transcriptional regulator n=1 Tax=Jatrophihabitans sp. TaxID=1932789 RepID=UPI003F7DFEB7